MPKKELGFVELEWTCPTCKVRNPGTATICSGCGTAQPAGVKFESAGATELVTDKAKIERAKVGPDIQCGFCGARNRADAKVCIQCAADLTAGKQREAGAVVGAFDRTALKPIICTACNAENPATNAACQKCGAPLGKPAAAPPPLAPVGGGSSSLLYIGIGVAVLVALACGAFFWMSAQTSTVTAVATGAQWQRTVFVEGLVPVQSGAWWDEVPTEARGVQCSAEMRSTSPNPEPNSREVCGTPYTEDTGTGMGRVVQDCEYQVFEDYCKFTTNQWQVVDTLSLNGLGFTPVWPAATLGFNQRVSGQREEYTCVLKGGDNEYRQPMSTYNEYERCQEGSSWVLEVDGFGSVNSMTPAQ